MRIGLLRRQQPFAEFVNGRWRIYYIYNNDVTSGTYYELASDGTCDRVTVADGSIIRIDRISNPPATEDVANEQADELQFMLNYSL